MVSNHWCPISIEDQRKRENQNWLLLRSLWYDSLAKHGRPPMILPLSKLLKNSIYNSKWMKIWFTPLKIRNILHPLVYTLQICSGKMPSPEFPKFDPPPGTCLLAHVWAWQFENQLRFLIEKLIEFVNTLEPLDTTLMVANWVWIETYDLVGTIIRESSCLQTNPLLKIPTFGRRIGIR